MSEGRRVVVTGLGIVSSIGQDVETYWQSLREGRNGIGPITGFDPAQFTCRIAGELRDFDPTRWMEKRLANRMDRYSQYGVAASVQAVKDSGLDFGKEDVTRCGAILSSGIGGLWEIEDQLRRLIDKGPGRVSPFLVPKLMANACAGQVAILFGLKGPDFGVVSACASANNGIGCAFHEIRHGYADVMVAGGAEGCITPLAIAGFMTAKALSTRNDDPAHASRPFDSERDGFVMGEGSGVIVLEELEHARKRGARIYAEVLGFGASDDAAGLVEPDVTGCGPSLAMKAALREGKVNPDEVQYVNAHGTSTPLGDKAETQAIKLAFGDHARKLAVSSTKSMIGHLLGASGGVEIVATILSVHHDTIHPTINYQNPDPECDLDYVPNQARQTRVDRAISNSFGFGGHNATVLVGKLK